MLGTRSSCLMQLICQSTSSLMRWHKLTLPLVFKDLKANGTGGTVPVDALLQRWFCREGKK